MIARALKYAGPSATVRTLFGDLLRPAEYELLLNAANVPEFLAALRTTRHAAALRSEGKSLAFCLQSEWVAHAEKVAAIVPTDARELCLAYLAKVEIEALKTVLRGIARGADRRRLLSILPVLPTGSSLPLSAILAADNLAKATVALKDTPYGEVVAEAIRTSEATSAEAAGSSPLLRVESGLDHRFFARLIKACEPFSSFEYAIVDRLIGTLADATNVLAVERLRKTFHLTGEAADTHLVEFGFRLRSSDRRRLWEWTGEGALPVWPGGGGRDGSLRTAVMRELSKEATRPLYSVPFQAGLAIAYVLLTELEIADLVAIYEGKKWGLEREAIFDRLIRWRGPTSTGESRA